MQPATDALITDEEFIVRERAAATKSEFLRGHVFAMSGARPKHNLVASNIIGALGERLRGRPCLVLTRDQRIYSEAAGLFTYPDVVVVCGGARFHAKFDDTLVNPTVIVEVLSPSTEAYDRGAKFAHYRTIASLREYVLVTPDATLVEHYARGDDESWRLTTFTSPGDAVTFPALGLAVPVGDIYAKVELLPDDDASTPKPPQPRGPKAIDRE